MSSSQTGGATIVMGEAQRVSRSERSDLAHLYQQEHLAMVRLARLIVGSTAVAEELVHDAFVAMLRRGEVESPGAYLRQAVVNNCRSHARRRSLGRAKVAELVASTPDLAALPPDVDETWQALRLVSTKQRVALVLRFYADLKVDDIAEAMGERPGTVKSLIHRGLGILRKELSS